MCGICGSLSLGREAVDVADVRSMLDAMVHRGPDSEGLFEEPGIAAGVRRLAVIDVDGGDQPISNEDGAVRVVFNGEIYNHGELRDELLKRGHRFRSRSDTEVLVHLWEERGPEMLHDLNGMFAFCLHDRRGRETFIARDRLGIKPLHYRLQGDRLAFASELATLLRHREVAREVDGSALVELFCLQYLSGDRTVYRQIRKLLPGHAMHVKNGALRLYPYYELPRGGPPEAVDAQEAAGELVRLFESSVRYRRVSDVPLGAFLSGGVDSSVVVHQLSRLVDHPVKTFSVGFDDAATFDERAHARTVAEAFGTDHHELVISPIDIAEQLPRLVDHLAEPVTDPAVIPTYLLSEFARRQVTVVLTGEGADELFGGYRRYLYQERFGWMARLPGIRGAGEVSLQRLLPRRVGQALDAISETDPARNHLEWSSTIGRSLASRMFDSSLFADYEERTRERFARYFHGDRVRLDEQLYADQHEWLPHNLLAKVDRASMAFSLEARVPYLDHRLVEWASGLPAGLKIRGGETKVVLRRAFGGRLPARILGRPKQGFDLPLAAWVRGPLRPLVSDLLTPARLRDWKGVDVSFVREMLDRHQAEKQDFGLPLFLVLSIMLFLDRR
jgi:asparagine synthase (glutamine-hydrolysing)